MMTAHRKSTKGQEMVEFALVLTFFLIIVLVIFDLGRAAYYYTAIHNAAREGARYGIVDPNTTRIQNAARSKAIGLELDPTVNLTDDTVEVIISYQFSAVTPVLAWLTGADTIDLVGRAVMNREP